MKINGGKMPDEQFDEKISPKMAVESATTFYRDTTADYARATLEEIEFRDGFWFVTLGFEKNALLYGQKEYKTFKVNAKTGHVEAMNVKLIR